MSHYGIYGAWWQDGALVTIRKSRGPYLGMLDLPGGSPEAAETPIETLERELLEECGVTGINVGSWHRFDFLVEFTSAGAPLNEHHRGLLALVEVATPVTSIRDVEDVAAVELIDPNNHELSELTPALRLAISLLARPTPSTGR
ncbi:NUDIX domain-containing protein [Arthrobacter agilis]|uniref:NUDIX domain-containing protein n=1 Tax=Arthrobacter agilis TaxID=37921 RepID=UPI000B35BBC5|nr:NUDIX domain-containing protein [Arthrobacter agilis]OUM45590.1 hypothetical protein B8W74_00340 [Arthrobacter agilis]PPB47754.1 NUDIX domain-containing protein [Arthrobacter agilis]TPV21641.1 NUDIX domain-containing protein [Arthrobacter agilis]VDR32251.1 mutator mutT protein [Arthrobacter agilis]